MVKVILTKEVIDLCGIEDTNPGDVYSINPVLLKGSSVAKSRITVFCEDCGKPSTIMCGSVYNNCEKNEVYLCRDCSMIRKYGTKNAMQNPDIKKKQQQTNMKKYGAKCCFLNPKVREKRRKTCLERYGSEEPFGSKEIQNKTEKTFLKKYGYKRAMSNPEVQEHNRQAFKEKYGVEYVGAIPEVREKIKQTMLERYGEDNPIRVQKFREKAVLNRLKNENDILYNGVRTSSQQKYLYKIYNGEINKLVCGYFVDIMLTDTIYFEYDGSGHNLNVQLGRQTQEEFDKRERLRESILEKYGYKEFKIVSSTDKLPDEDFLLELKNEAINCLNNGHNYFIYNIETKEKIIK